MDGIVAGQLVTRYRPHYAVCWNPGHWRSTV